MDLKRRLQSKECRIACLTRKQCKWPLTCNDGKSKSARSIGLKISIWVMGRGTFA